jgi:hypothetical protein
MGSADITGLRGSGEDTDPWEEARGLFEMYLIDMMKFSKRGCGDLEIWQTFIFHGRGSKGA